MEGYQIGSVLEADRVERFLAAAGHPAGHAEIAGATGIRGAKLTRILATLKTCGRIEEPADGRWVLAADFLSLFATCAADRFAAAAAALHRQIEAILNRRPQP